MDRKQKWAIGAAVTAILLLGGILFAISDLAGGKGSTLAQRLSGGSFLETGGLLGLLANSTEQPVLLLDPGHGGIDGGATSAKGLPEKDINLSIALEVKDLAEADGWQVIMTRTEDRGLYEGVTEDGKGNASSLGGQSIRNLKTQDLKNRKAMVDELQPELAVSIHLNSYKEDTSVRGAQVFYGSKGDSKVLEESRLLAEQIQAALVEGLGDGNHRVAMSEGGVRFLQNPAAPTVLVECGFLSNPEEAALLADPAYQKKLAACIYAGICAKTGRQPRRELPPLLDTLRAAN